MAERALHVVVVRVGFLAEHAAQVRAERHLLVDQLRILAILIHAGVDDLLLLVGDLQAVGLRILAAIHQVRQRQEGPHQDLLVVLAGIIAHVVVGQHGQCRAAVAGLLERVEAIAHLPQRLLGLAASPFTKVEHGMLEPEHVAIVLRTLERLVDPGRGLGQVAGAIQLARLNQLVGVRGAAGQDSQHQRAARATNAAEHGSTVCGGKRGGDYFSSLPSRVW